MEPRSFNYDYNRVNKTPKYRYQQQKASCSSRKRLDRNGDPIEFRLTFDEWVKIWTESGQLANRGKGRGKYVMARYNDIGHYEVGNVYITEDTKNFVDAMSHCVNKRLTKLAKQVQTPLGVFDSIAAAARAHGLCKEGLRRRVLRSDAGYRFV